MVGGQEVVADGERESKYGAGLDLIWVDAEICEQRPQVLHPPVVDASEALGDGAVAS